MQIMFLHMHVRVFFAAVFLFLHSPSSLTHMLRKGRNCPFYIPKEQHKAWNKIEKLNYSLID